MNNRPDLEGDIGSGVRLRPSAVGDRSCVGLGLSERSAAACTLDATLDLCSSYAVVDEPEVRCVVVVVEAVVCM